MSASSSALCATLKSLKLLPMLGVPSLVPAVPAGVEIFWGVPPGPAGVVVVLVLVGGGSVAVVVVEVEVVRGGGV